MNCNSECKGALGLVQMIVLVQSSFYISYNGTLIELLLQVAE